MTRIRKLEVRHFRSIAALDWWPAAGLNCLIGSGDSGKSTVLDALDMCLGARRNLNLTDTDFHGLDVSRPITISVTLGELPQSLLNLDAYGEFLRGFETATGRIDDEPADTLETVITMQLTIGPDLEPVWRLYSDRTREDEPRALPWKERMSLSPARLGQHGSSHLSWTRGSVLNRLSEERPEVGIALLGAARDARLAFGEQAGAQLEQALRTVTETARWLGVPVGVSVKALLDAHAVSFSEGSISLHSEAGVPLKALGTGSVRLLLAGLQRAAAASASVVLVDEVEYGLEPHRIIRLLDSLGAKEEAAPLQVFLTTHSPVVLRELPGSQLFVMRNTAGVHTVSVVGVTDDVQSTIRRDPEAFLAHTVLVCEGASEVGLIRGLDEYWSAAGRMSLQASGVAYVDTGGGDADRAFYRGMALRKLGYRVAVVQDNDKQPTRELVDAFIAHGGAVFAWRPGRALEDELFLSMPAPAVTQMLQRAQEYNEDTILDAHIRNASNGAGNLQLAFQDSQAGCTQPVREALGRAARTRKAGWFKSISKMSGVAREIVGPNLDHADPAFVALVTAMFAWAHDARN